MMGSRQEDVIGATRQSTAMRFAAVCVSAAALLAHAGSRAADVADLRFREFFRLPVGPQGLEPSARLLALDGSRVRIVGYMVQQADATAGIVVLAPMPVSLGGEDESFADDLPASAVYVHLSDESLHVPQRAGLLALTGRLQVGAFAEADGRRSFVRLFIDEPTSLELARLPMLEKPDVRSSP
jgi:hypothetical protein